MQTTYLSAAETAKLVRKALKQGFPGVKFTVRSSTYSGGASIQVGWTDGPCEPAVKAIAGQYAGGNFDGSIDMKTGHTSWLLPDGSAIIASDPGTTGSMGSRPATRNWMPHPEAKLVHFQADFIFCDRHTSVALLKRAVARLAAKGYPVETIDIIEGAYPGVKANTWSPEATRGFDMEREVWRAASRTHCVTA